MQSERRRIQNLFKNLRWSVFAQTVNGLNPLTETEKHSILDVYASAEKQGRCKASKKNPRGR